MSREPAPETRDLLASYPREVVELALALRALVLEMAPGMNEMVFDTYNAVSIAFTHTARWQDAFCHVAVYAKHVNLGFNRGSELPDPERRLRGTGKLIRHLSIRSAAELEEPTVRHFLELACARVAADAGADRSPTVTVRRSAGPKRRPAPPGA